MNHSSAFEQHRLAATFVEAAYTGDDEQVAAVLAVINPAAHQGDPEQLNGLLVALVGMVEHALKATPAADVPAFVQAYRRVLDQAERLAEGEEPN